MVFQDTREEVTVAATATSHRTWVNPYRGTSLTMIIVVLELDSVRPRKRRVRQVKGCY